MSIEEEQNKKLLLKVVQTQEETQKINNRVLEVAETIFDQIKDNHEEALKKMQTIHGACNILEKNQKTMWKKLLELGEEEPEAPERAEKP